MAGNEALHVDAVAKAQVDARQASEPVEQRLCAGDVHRGDALVRGPGELAGDAQRRVAQADLEQDGSVARQSERAHRRRGREERIRPQHVEAVRPPARQGPAGSPRRGTDRGRRRAASRRAPRCARRPRSTGLATATSGSRAKRTNSVSSKPLRGPLTHQVGVAAHRAHALREGVDRGTVDELNGEAERNAQRDREHGDRSCAGGSARTRRARTARRVRDVGRPQHRIRPARRIGRRPSRVSTSTRSAVRAAASECVTSMPAAPRPFTWSRNSARIAAALSGSRLPVGSSASTSIG